MFLYSTIMKEEKSSNFSIYKSFKINLSLKIAPSFFNLYMPCISFYAQNEKYQNH